MKIRYSMLPKSDPREDYYVFYDKIINDEQKLIGVVFNEDKSIKIEVVESDALIRQTHHRSMYFCVDEKKYLTESYIVLSSYMSKKLEENPFLMAMIWHEIGHFHTLPFMLGGSEMPREKRRGYVFSDRVMPEELVADLFSMYAVGKEDTLKALRWLRNDRKKMMPDDPNTMWAVREFNNRIHALEKIDEDKAYDEFLKLFEEHRYK